RGSLLKGDSGRPGSCPSGSAFSILLPPASLPTLLSRDVAAQLPALSAAGAAGSARRSLSWAESAPPNPVSRARGFHLSRPLRSNGQLLHTRVPPPVRRAGAACGRRIGAHHYRLGIYCNPGGAATGRRTDPAPSCASRRTDTAGVNRSPREGRAARG